MAGQIHSAVLKEPKKLCFLSFGCGFFFASLPCSLWRHSSMLRSASKNLSLRKTAAPLSLACKLWKLAQLQRGKLTEDLRQLEMWHSKFSSPRESSLFVCGPTKPWQLIFFCRDAKASRLASGFASFAFCECVCLKKEKKEVYKPSFGLLCVS